MILSTRLPRSIRHLLNPVVPGDQARASRPEAGHEADTRSRRDPDWAIREIVDEVMFETAR